MAISQEWTKATRNMRELFLALRTGLGSSWASTRTRKARPGKTSLATVRGVNAPDMRVLAELERRKSLAYLNNARNQVR